LYLPPHFLLERAILRDRRPGSGDIRAERQQMDKSQAIDPGCVIDWGKVSSDYATHRPGPPRRFYDSLAALGVGLAGQAILDLGTGTGVLARQFATQGAHAAGVDIAENQILAARELALRDGLEVDFRVAPSEHTPFPEHTFDVVTAMQCWIYFEPAQVSAEVKRLLRGDGCLVVSYFSWLPRLDRIAGATERLVLRYNPNWTAGDWSGEIEAHPKWAPDGFRLTGMFWFDEAVPFTRESWRGRIRACRGTGAALDTEVVQRFDSELAQVLTTLAANEFTVLHRLSTHVFRKGN
jgi:2-polyprenyl-3-methyl-5-hydroxy-6-metoxy-1,4-benzoquinol methylase